MSILGLEKRSIGNARVVLRRISNPFAYERDLALLETYIHEELQLPWANPYVDFYSGTQKPFQAWMQGELNLWIGREVIGPLETNKSEDQGVCDLQQGIIYVGKLPTPQIRDWQHLDEEIERGKSELPLQSRCLRLRFYNSSKQRESEYAPVWEYQFFGSAQPLVDNFLDCH